MAPASSVNLQFIADQFARGLEEIRQTLKDLDAKVGSNAVEMASVQKDIEGLHNKVDDLYNVVRGEDGTVSVLNRLTIVENGQKEINKWIDEQKTGTTEKNKSNLQIKLAVIAGTFALVLQIASVFLNIIK